MATDFIGHIGTFTKTGAQIWRTGLEKSEGGKGVKWSCSTHGVPKRAPGPDGKMRTENCEDLNHFFRATGGGGVIPSGFELTAGGAVAAKACLGKGCMGKARSQGKGPKSKAPPAAPQAPGGFARSGPCPCGSRRRMRKCEGTPEAPHPKGEPGNYVLPTPPPAPPQTPPAPPPPKTPKEVKREKARIYRFKEEAAATVRAKRVDQALENAHAWDEARRAKRAEYDRKRREAAKSKASS